jgi:hypothetical protein
MYSERWKNVAYEVETGGTDFVRDWVSKEIAIRHRTTTYMQINKNKQTCHELLLVHGRLHNSRYD